MHSVCQLRRHAMKVLKHSSKQHLFPTRQQQRQLQWDTTKVFKPFKHSHSVNQKEASGEHIVSRHRFSHHYHYHQNSTRRAGAPTSTRNSNLIRRRTSSVRSNAKSTSFIPLYIPIKYSSIPYTYIYSTVSVSMLRVVIPEKGPQLPLVNTMKCGHNCTSSTSINTRTTAFPLIFYIVLVGRIYRDTSVVFMVLGGLAEQNS